MHGALLITPQSTAVGRAFGQLEVGWERIYYTNPETGVVVIGGTEITAGAAATQMANGPDAVDGSGFEDFISRPAEKVGSTGITLRPDAD
jgi:hypothetical protein